MASTGLNFSNLTPDNGAIKDLKRLIFLAVTDPESLGKIFNFLPKQKHGEKVGFIGEFGMVGKASQGCNPTFGTSVLATSEKEWDIREWEVAEKICYKDLEGTVAQVAMRTKTNIADLTGTEYTDYILAPRLELAIRKMLMRYAWFGDKAADTVTDGGNLLDSIDSSTVSGSVCLRWPPQRPTVEPHAQPTPPRRSPSRKPPCVRIMLPSISSTHLSPTPRRFCGRPTASSSTSRKR